jgi:hypothetical protein
LSVDDDTWVTILSVLPLTLGWAIAQLKSHLREQGPDSRTRAMKRVESKIDGVNASVTRLEQRVHNLEILAPLDSSGGNGGMVLPSVIVTLTDEEEHAS